ncbi:hypothetical protein I551_8810 [Mycobacterium ulcerans str. Harvey]|uniref:DUF4349 domain-containing protein n=1 Tax=Mycobacterium ulcerans str. Harvey TaxID=1299332 RepID=A0ABN0R9T0_MYCUL|nr:hypothetical protein I551_8810 [Mycobacterium ulcerans str. Harvey]
MALVSALLVGTGWIWSLSGDGLSTATRDQSTGIVGDKPPEIADSIGIPETKGSLGGTENTVALRKRRRHQGPRGRNLQTGHHHQRIAADGRRSVRPAADQLAAAVSDAAAGSTRAGTLRGLLAHGQPRRAHPADKLDGVLADAKNLGEVESMSIGHTDVTSQRVDLDARIEALQTSVNRLRELMAGPAVLPTYSPRSRR